MVCVVVKSLTLCIIWGWCHIQRCSDCILDQKGKTLRWCRSGQKGESSRIKFEGQSALQRWHLGMKKINKVYYCGIKAILNHRHRLHRGRLTGSEKCTWRWQWSMAVLFVRNLNNGEREKKSTRKWGVLWTIYFFWGGGTEPLLCSHHHSWSPPQPEQTDPQAHFSAAESDGEGPLFILSGLWWSHWLSERN